MQRQRFLCIFFLSFFTLIAFLTNADASNCCNDPEPIVPFVHQNGGYGDFLAGFYAARTNDNAIAAQLYNKVMKLNPSNPELHWVTFYHSVLAGDDLAIHLAASEKDPIAKLILANDALTKNQWNKAFIYFSNPPPDSFSQMTYPLLQAWCIFSLGDHEKAINLLEQQGKNMPLSGLYYLQQALMYSLMQEEKKAGDKFEQAIIYFPGPDLLLTQAYGNWLIRSHRMGKADELLGVLIDNLPFLSISEKDLRTSLLQLPVKNAQQAIAQIYVAVASLIQQDLLGKKNIDFKISFENKIALHTEQIFLRLAINLDPTLSSAKLMLSGVLSQEKQLSLAKNILLPIANKDPLNSLMQLRVAQLNEQLGLYTQAEIQLKDIASEQSRLPDVWQSLGDTYFDQKKYVEAIFSYSKVLSLSNINDKFLWPVLFTRAIAYENLKLWNKAVKDLKKALMLAPNEPLLLNYLGYSWALKNTHLVEAQSLLQKAVDISPDEGAIRDSLGWVMLLNGDTKGAIKQLEHASESIPQDPELNYHLGVAYWKSGRRREAINQWNIALTCSPTPEEKKLILEALSKKGQFADFLKKKGNKE